jgi:hypothetical protein
VWTTAQRHRRRRTHLDTFDADQGRLVAGFTQPEPFLGHLVDTVAPVVAA